MISRTRARYGAVSPGRPAASSRQPRHARCPRGAKGREGERALVPLQPQAPARTATAAASTTQREEQAGGIDGRPCCRRAASHALPCRSLARSARRGCTPALRALHAHVQTCYSHGLTSAQLGYTSYGDSRIRFTPLSLQTKHPENRNKVKSFSFATQSKIP
jgi:hypothetical protein